MFTLRFAVLFGLLTVIVLAGCSSTRPPSSAFPGLYSTTTGLQNLLPEFSRSRSLFDDFTVLSYRKIAGCDADTSYAINLEWDGLKSIPHAFAYGMPGCVRLTKDGLGIDEAEVPNIEWKRYQQRLAAANGNVAATQLALIALPVPDYFTNPFYDYYPVVGVSYEQAAAFCNWRGQVITSAVNSSKPGSPDNLAAEHVVVECRLPTEAEWERAALAGRALPYGTRCPEAPLTVNPKAAAYLKQRSGSGEAEAKIKADIAAYNRRAPVRSFINHEQPEPYFLRLATPGYVFQGPPNDNRIYQLLGNVAEMVQESVTKGGSYRDPLSACTITARGRYAGPAPTVGFRCVTRATLPNQR